MYGNFIFLVDWGQGWGWSHGNEPSGPSQESGVRKAGCPWAPVCGGQGRERTRREEAQLLCCPGKVLEDPVRILEPGHMFRTVPVRGWGLHLYNQAHPGGKPPSD